MNLRFLNQLIIAAAIVGSAAYLSAQGVRQRSYKMAAPFASVSRHASDSSALGRVDGGVNQTVELGITGQSDAMDSASPGLDQIQSSSRQAGQRSAASSRGAITSRGSQRSMSSQGYASVPMAGGTRSPRQRSFGTPFLAPNNQSAPGKLSPSALDLRGVPRLQTNRLDAAKRSAGSRRNYLQPGNNVPRSKRGAENEDISTIQEGGQNPLERLQDPFLAPSTAGFEGSKGGFEFERPCGDTCGLRAAAPSEPAAGESRGRRRLADVPDAQSTATRSIYGQAPSLSTEPRTSLPTKPY